MKWIRKSEREKQHIWSLQMRSVHKKLFILHVLKIYMPGMFCQYIKRSRVVCCIMKKDISFLKLYENAHLFIWNLKLIILKLYYLAEYVPFECKDGILARNNINQCSIALIICWLDIKETFDDFIREQSCRKNSKRRKRL